MDVTCKFNDVNEASGAKSRVYFFGGEGSDFNYEKSNGKRQHMQTSV